MIRFEVFFEPSDQLIVFLLLLLFLISMIRMETNISPVNWQQPLSLNRSTIIFDIPYRRANIYPVIDDTKSNKSFLHSQKLRESILESKRVFLNHSLNDEKPEDEQMEEKPLLGFQLDTKKNPSKKISFKIKKQSSLYRRNGGVPKVTNIPTNKVAELTKKFNEMVENRTFWEEQRIKMSSANSESSSNIVHRDSMRVTRKPSVKTKPSLDGKNLVIIKTRKTSIKKQNSIRAKAEVIDKKLEEQQPIRPTTLNINLNIPKAILETSPNGTSVREAIEIFEKKYVPSSPTKPAIPEKSPAVRNLMAKIATLPSSYRRHAQDKVIEKHITDETKMIDESMNVETVTEFEDDAVQIINIPAVLPQRRCDSMYETLNLKKIQTQPLKAKSVDNINTESKPGFVLPNTSFLWRDKSPSSASSRSSINTQFQERLTNVENAKKPPDIPPKPSVRILKKKMTLPDESPMEKDDLDDYEVIGECMIVSNELKEIISEDNIIVNEETFKGSDEITKLINEFEIIDSPLTNVSNIDHYEEIKKEDKIYEELSNMSTKIDDGYEPIGHKLEESVYEQCPTPKSENIYETLPAPPIPLRRQQQEPLPPRPPSSNRNDDTVYNCYESIYTKKDAFYESIYGSQLTTDSGSNRDSVLSSDQKSNSLYGHSLPRFDYNSDNMYYKPPSDISDRVSERSDEWEDVTDNEEGENRIIVVREKTKGRKSGWSQHFREQLSKSLKENVQSGNENDHHYESLYTAKEDEDFDYDSFESDTDSDTSFDKIRIVDDSGIDMGNNRLPEPPNNQSYRLMKFAEKNMKKISRNLTMNITKSLTRMKKHMSKTDPDPKTKPTYENVETQNSILKQSAYSASSVETFKTPSTAESHSSEDQERSKTLLRNKGGFLNKFRRSMSLSTESANELTSNLNGGSKTKSTFYLTETIDVDSGEGPSEYSDKSLSPVLRHSRSPLMRPKSPPPPAPIAQSDLQKSNRQDGKAASWYTDSGVFRNNENAVGKRPNTFWYAEVGLYQAQGNSTPSTSSTENSGSNLSTPIKPFEIPRPVLKPSDFINQDDNVHFNNMKNENPYYTESVNSYNSVETKKDESLKQEIQLRLQDEPLYQFYDAAVLESISYGDTSSDFDSDNYEDVYEKKPTNNVIKIRPSAMELVTPNRNSICFTKTLWCDIPEVINSSVLSTLSAHQKKLQEAKFEILTSEASYLNSLNVLNNHFVQSFSSNNILAKEERDVLFGHVEEVRTSSEKLLHDLEKCWQDNILLHGICDIIQKHAEENFNVYIPYCENQMLFDDTLKNLRERLGFTEFLKHLEMSEACQSLSLYSFLMLPMQRITRWPLLVDAVLKRLPQQDQEYYACQFALATVNKIVSQCNEAARQKERETELLKLAKQLEFPQSVPKIPIISPDRWLIRCGPVVHMQSRNEDNKLTFGKRFIKNNIHIFLFNDLFLVAKEKSEKNYVVQQYCPRNLVELSTSEVMLTVTTKEAQNKNLIFLTVLENQDGKTIEYLLSCSSESDKERWNEALTPPKSEDPEETLYECWDCPQVTAIHSYAASQPDELALTKGDVINVLRKMADGWYHGERIRDGQTGWFPANHTVEIANFHVRARNLKQRYRLLAFSENYLKSK
ncbi:unnamed protein product [Ceutorhynchus assimilis]|uniref:Rho guanine nucleotide exchange factor 5 n=1 Tax=Ceutorhynchus assimilis TaxID=467358 RepID=A0A9N9MDG7_9CUCU|nr:unnamed protein product [Ceutorhynchus assimilis]